MVRAGNGSLLGELVQGPNCPNGFQSGAPQASEISHPRFIDKHVGSRLLAPASLRMRANAEGGWMRTVPADI